MTVRLVAVFFRRVSMVASPGLTTLLSVSCNLSQGVMKKLQICEQAMKLQRNWQTRQGSVVKAYSDFNDDFASLRSFAASSPGQTIDCLYIWKLSLQLEVRLAPCFGHHRSHNYHPKPVPKFQTKSIAFFP